MLVIALVLAGAGLTVAIGGTAILDTQASNEYQRAEHSMTLFDSRAAMVALGDADAQRVSLGHDRGTISVHDDTGWMRITHANYSDSGETEMIFNETLGSVVYESEEGTIAYQGGGVWKTQQGGQAQMISPPEFHYRGATLTLPAIQVTGDGAASGSVDLTVTPRQQARVVYPNATTATEDGTGAPYDETATTSYRNYTNPVRNGTVNVTVHSEYADGWESYFKQRTTGKVTRPYGPDEDTVRLTLESLSGPPGNFDMPKLGGYDTVEAYGIASNHSIKEFATDFVFDKTGGGTNEFSYWDQSGEKQWELHVSPADSGNLKCNNGSPDSDVIIAQYYYDGNTEGEYEFWEVTLDPDTTDAVEWSCDGAGHAVLSVDFMNTDPETQMEYNDETFKSGKGSGGDVGGNQWYAAAHIKENEMKDPLTLDGHGEINSCEPGNYSKGDFTNCTLGHIVDHYMSEMGPNIDIHAKNGPGQSGPIKGPLSEGKLLYEKATGGKYVTYLHITENEIEVDT
ncbi:putative pilin/flagellin [Halapricum desulfuricans]|uniref:Putative pilin/flagellin n=1 Tax=Halapricum desulfuricans TaxID=2841257 RepID=A0A897NGA5_9EURY|nr:putative pilin/flagellin [Halapricum desulfuricans]